jgi:hypothetical protein
MTSGMHVARCAPMFTRSVQSTASLCESSQDEADCAGLLSSLLAVTLAQASTDVACVHGAERQ